MWEQIRANRRRSAMLIVGMAGLLCVMGYALGEGVVGPGAGPFGMLVAFAIFAVQMLVYYAAGESVAMSGLNAREVPRDEMPRLHNIVEEMKIASGLPFMPKVYMVDSQMPNAFAVGRTPERSAVAVTTGLLYRLNRDELQGVIAHEIAHLKNRDTKFMTLAAVMLGSIVIMSELIWRSMQHGGRSASRSRARGNSDAGGQVIILIIALLVALLGPLMAQMLYFAVSRKREYLADAAGASFTRYPEGLASALERIAGSGRGLDVSKAVAPMFIINPLKASGESSSLFSTHPPTGDRVRILRSMAGGSLLDYEEAYRAAHKGAGVIGRRSLGESERMPARAGSGEGPILQKAEARASVYGRAGFFEMSCDCGVGIRVPSTYELDTVRCPRCGRANPLPSAGAPAARPAATPGIGMGLGAVIAATAAQAGSAAPQAVKGASEQAQTAPGGEAPMEYVRRGGGWENFRCQCGGAINLSPGFTGNRVQCMKCHRIINIRHES